MAGVRKQLSGSPRPPSLPPSQAVESPRPRLPSLSFLPSLAPFLSMSANWAVSRFRLGLDSHDKLGGFAEPTRRIQAGQAAASPVMRRVMRRGVCRLHDFGFRGCTCVEQAGRGGGWGTVRVCSRGMHDTDPCV